MVMAPLMVLRGGYGEVRDREGGREREAEQPNDGVLTEITHDSQATDWRGYIHGVRKPPSPGTSSRGEEAGSFLEGIDGGEGGRRPCSDMGRFVVRVPGRLCRKQVGRGMLCHPEAAGLGPLIRRQYATRWCDQEPKAEEAGQRKEEEEGDQERQPTDKQPGRQAGRCSVNRNAGAAGRQFGRDPIVIPTMRLVRRPLVDWIADSCCPGRQPGRRQEAGGRRQCRER